jgi:hypothetical protein
MKRLRNWFNYANVTGTIALFLAMSGVAAAVTLAPTNSVTSRSIKDGQVRTADLHANAITRSRLAPNAVTGSKVVDGSLLGADIADSSVTGSDVEDGSISTYDLGAYSVGSSELQASSVGPSKLEASSVGSRELGQVTAVVGEGVDVLDGHVNNAVVFCPASHPRLIAGGYSWSSDSAGSIISSAPNESHPDTSWVVRGKVPAGSSNGLFAWATCLAP